MPRYMEITVKYVIYFVCSYGNEIAVVLLVVLLSIKGKEKLMKWHS